MGKDPQRKRIRRVVRSWHVDGGCFTLSPLNRFINWGRGFALKLVLVYVIVVTRSSSSLSSSFVVCVFVFSLTWKCLAAVVTVVAEAPASAATAAEGKIFVVSLLLHTSKNWVFPGKFSSWVFYGLFWVPFWLNCMKKLCFVYSCMRTFWSPEPLFCFTEVRTCRFYRFLGCFAWLFGYLFGKFYKKK